MSNLKPCPAGAENRVSQERFSKIKEPFCLQKNKKMPVPIGFFFFSTWKAHSFREHFSLASAKINIVREKISKSTYGKPKVSEKKRYHFRKKSISIREKKMHAWKPKSGREKSCGNIWMYLFLQMVYDFVTIFFSRRFFHYWSEFLCVKIKTFLWKKSFLWA